MKSFTLLFVLISTLAAAQMQVVQLPVPLLPPDVTFFKESDIEFDQNNDAWMALGVGGVLHEGMLSSEWYSGSSVPVLQNADIVSIEIDQNNEMWLLNSWDVQIIHFVNGVWSIVPQNNPFPAGTKALWMEQDSQGNLWVSCHDWVDEWIAMFDGANWISYTGLPLDLITWYHSKFTIDGSDQLLWGTNDLLYTYIPGNLQSIGLPQPQGTGSYVSDIEVDAGGNVLVMMTYQLSGSTFYTYLCTYDGISWQTQLVTINVYYTSPQFGSDDSGNGWFGFESSLLQVNGSGVQSVATIFQNYKYDVAVDGLGRKWVVTNDSMGGSGDNFSVMMYNDVAFNVVVGDIYFDQNGDGIHDFGEPGLSNLSSWLQPLNFHQLSDNTGHYEIPVVNTSGIYDVSLQIPLGWNQTSLPSTYSVTQTFQGEVSSGIDFGIAPQVVEDDGAVEVSASPARPGFTLLYLVNLTNPRTTILSGQVTATFDNQLLFYGSSEVPVSQTGNSLTWDFTGLLPFEIRSISIYFGIPQSINIGTVLNYDAQMAVNGTDVNPANNSFIASQTVTGAIDPNEKIVDPVGVGWQGTVDPGTTFTYTVFFQNTGTDTAFNVIIYDDLDDDFDRNSVQFICSSHPCNFEILGNGLIRAAFSNIMLPDSNVNEPASHGFFQYRVTPYASSALGTVVMNSAAIVFDFNEPVITNTTLNTLGIVTDVDAPVSEINDFAIYPNPANNSVTIETGIIGSSAILMDISGRIVRSSNLNFGKAVLDVSSFADGMYFILVQNGELIANEKLIVLH